MPDPFGIHNGMLTGKNGRTIIADELDIPSPHTRQYHNMEAHIHQMDDREAVRFAAHLRHSAHAFDRQDTLDQARSEGRMVYRSWPADPNASSPAVGTGHDYVSGFSSLTTTRNPLALRRAQIDFQQGVQHDPFTSVPSTLLGRDPTHPEKIWSGSGPGMVTALLPEAHYVAMEALHRRAQHADASPALRAVNAELREEITRPHLFANEDLSSMVLQIGTETERRGRPSMRSDNPASDYKLRENATRYQSYIAAHGTEQQVIHNEITVHHRQTGHATPAVEMRHEMQQPMRQEPDKTFMGMVYSRGARVPDGPPVQVLRPIQPAADTRALGRVLATPHTFPVLKE